MRRRIRKLIGLVLLLAFLAFYALMVVALAAGVLPHAHWLVQTAFYAIGGLLWVLPAGLLIRWMARPDPGEE